ncbi:hypothetical protein F4802DRAFT_297477 [Xylaria palmicola]|nr:hypothetical protein F4802DRAFT_297477 [Xylaria palmicola]
MSLGFESLWRARSRIIPAQGLSSALTAPRNPPFSSQAPARRWPSVAVKSPPQAADAESSTPWACPLVAEADSALERGAEAKPLPSSVPRISYTSSLTGPVRLAPDAAKRRIPSLDADPLIKRPVQYSDRRASLRSLRKHTHSARKQVMHEVIREALKKPPRQWSSTLDLMINLTPKFRDKIDLKVAVTKEAAARARASLSDVDTNLWQIQQRHHVQIHIESGSHKNEAIILSISGTEFSVQESLLELIGAIGEASAVRILNPTTPISSSLPDVGMSTAEDETQAQVANFVEMAQRPRHRLYELTMRADEIPLPTEWTKSSFEQYVADLVFARVPTHLHQSIYPDGLNHQWTVINILTRLFSSETFRHVVSATALNMALRFMQSIGRACRPAIRTLFNEAERLCLPINAKSFQTFLVRASRDGDLSGFTSVVRAMKFRGHYIRAENWVAFLAMIHDPSIKQLIISKMKSRGLHHLQPVLEAIGRENMMMCLEQHAASEVRIEHLIAVHDKRYGPSWLNTITLNRMLDVLGLHGKFKCCNELLDFVEVNGRARPDQYTLNIMLTHARDFAARFVVLSRWPGLRLDSVTYNLLFNAAWKQRLPNVLRVIWRYAAFEGMSSSHMRHVLTKLMLPQIIESKKRVFLKSWEDVIFGRDELFTIKALSSNGSSHFGASQLIKKYLQDADGLRPVANLGDKLDEAYTMDMDIHKLRRNGTPVTSSVRQRLTVDIPLGDAPRPNRQRV